MIVLDRVGRQRKPAVMPYAAAQFATYTEWERANFHVTNTEIATMMLDEWRFAAELVSAVQEHLLARESGYSDRLACVLNLAGAVAAELGHALPGEAAAWALTPGKLSGAGIDEEYWRDMLEQTRQRFDQHRTALE